MTTPEPHLNAVELRLCLEALPPRERQLVEHLLGCPSCRTALERQLGRTPPEDSRYDPAISRAIERAADVTRQEEPRVAEERTAAHRLLDELWTLRPDHWPALFLRSPSPAFLLLVLDAAARVAPRDPNTAETLARQVRAASQRPEAEIPEILRAELKVRAWAVAGRARAQRREWVAADAAYEEASRGLAEVPNLDVEAELCRFLAAGFVARDRLTEAAALLGRAALLAGAAGQVQAEIGDLGELAWLCSRRGDLDQAVGLLARALLRADDAGLEVAAAGLRLRLVWTLRQLGEIQDAVKVAPASIVSALRADAARLLITALDRACRGETSAAQRDLEATAYSALIEGDGLLAAIAALTLLNFYVLEDRGDKLRELAAAIGLLAEPQNGLAAETRAALAALDVALQAGTGSVGALLLAAAAALDRHEGPSGDDASEVQSL